VRQTDQQALGKPLVGHWVHSPGPQCRLDPINFVTHLYL
jgi:hypothetical protein